MKSKVDKASGKGASRPDCNKPPQRDSHKNCGCNIAITINCTGNVNIYNCTSDSAPSPTDDSPTPCGDCIPAIAGAKHKLSRAQRLQGIAAHARVPSALAAGTLHMLRRFLAGKSAANAMESAVFSRFSSMSPEVLGVMRCASAAYEDIPKGQRNVMTDANLDLGIDQPLNPDALADAWGRELGQRTTLQLFGDIAAADQARPGRIRVYEPPPEDFFSQVRICSINSLRTTSYIPILAAGDYLPAEIQQDCAPVVGQAQPVCEVRTENCPGHQVYDFCARVLDIAPGDSVMLQGVNYFSVDAVVRLTARPPLTVTRDIAAFVWGDDTTPVNDSVTGTLINDCRVQDRASFTVPDDLPSGVYEVNVVVPNITGIAAFGNFLTSNTEFINVLPPANARFTIVAEAIGARQETSPASFGADEVGLHTESASLLADGTTSIVGALTTDYEGDDFDSGEGMRDITRNIYAQQEVIQAMVVLVTGYEIDSDHAYDELITSVSEIFWDTIKEQMPYIAAASAALVTKFGWAGVIAAAIGIAILAAVDLIYALWAPADPVIYDSIGLSINELIELTSAAYPLPGTRSFPTENGIKVNVTPLEKIPLQYRERREYVSSEQESRYEIIYRVNRIS